MRPFFASLVSIRLRYCAVMLVLCLAAHAQAKEPSKADAKKNGPANAASAQVYDEAMRILNGLKKTEYKHKTDIDEEKGVYLCDCSGFVGYVLNQTVAKDDPEGALGRWQESAAGHALLQRRSKRRRRKPRAAVGNASSE